MRARPAGVRVRIRIKTNAGIEDYQGVSEPIMHCSLPHAARSGELPRDHKATREECQ
jgi:hypothetical protein